MQKQELQDHGIRHRATTANNHDEFIPYVLERDRLGRLINNNQIHLPQTTPIKQITQISFHKPKTKNSSKKQINLHHKPPLKFLNPNFYQLSSQLLQSNFKPLQTQINFSKKQELKTLQTDKNFDMKEIQYQKKQYTSHYQNLKRIELQILNQRQSKQSKEEIKEEKKADIIVQSNNITQANQAPTIGTYYLPQRVQKKPNKTIISATNIKHKETLKKSIRSNTCNTNTQMSNNNNFQHPDISIKVNKNDIKQIMQQADMKSYTERRTISSVDLVKGWTEKELSYKYKDLIIQTKQKFRCLRDKLQEWPETSIKNFHIWLKDLQNQDIVYKKQMLEDIFTWSRQNK